MPLGQPLYDIGDEVSFSVKIDSEHDSETEFIGKVAIVDPFGIFGDNSKCYYDVYVEEAFDGEPCLFKHLPEETVSPA